MRGPGTDASTREAHTVLGRALAILETFSNERPEQTLGMITRATGLPPATVHRLLAELVGWGAVERVGRGRYQIGMRLWQLGSLAPGGRGLRDAALPFLEDLFEATHQVVHLAVLDGRTVLYVEKLMARPEVEVVSRVGRRLPLHSTGPGKVLLAYGPQALFDDVVAAGLPKLAANTITDPDGLRQALADIRRTGFCLSRDEMTQGASSVAAPVFGPGREVLASISVVVPSSTKNLYALVPAVRVAALGISRAL
ncbi:MAG TPA: IclR family transcriptional regulator [Planosporangium sp.]|jgi:DNA-binding IclR family transcriptional regulator|nr:IclR family transcriptional regulator [Planosporangium sp.]